MSDIEQQQQQQPKDVVITANTREEIPELSTQDEDEEDGRKCTNWEFTRLALAFIVRMIGCMLVVGIGCTRYQRTGGLLILLDMVLVQGTMPIKKTKADATVRRFNTRPLYQKAVLMLAFAVMLCIIITSIGSPETIQSLVLTNCRV
jgi:hypothetical protein